jgi:hypothetical protein
VAISNGLCQLSPHRIDFVHMPVPRSRIDDAYFAPLTRLALSPGTGLVLGLIHYTDGIEGGTKRIAAAEKYVKDFDLATECGFGRREPSTIPDLLS